MDAGNGDREIAGGGPEHAGGRWAVKENGVTRRNRLVGTARMMVLGCVALVLAVPVRAAGGEVGINDQR